MPKLASDVMQNLAVATTVVCLVKFAVEGVKFVVAGHTFDFGHADSMVYAALLAPVLGAHSYVKVRRAGFRREMERVDNPDEE